MPLASFRLNTLSRFIASILAGRTPKTVAALGNAQVDTAQSQFGGASALFDGTGDYIKTTSGSFDFSTDQDFTVELFVRMNSNNNTRVFWTLFDGTTARGVLYTTSTQLSFYSPATGGVSLGDFPSTGVWYHLALSRLGTTTRIFYNGVETYSTTTSWTGTSDRIVFGTDNESTVANPYDGWMDEIRVSSFARYTSSFTPPTQAFANDNNTLLLIHANGTDASTTFTDDTTGAGHQSRNLIPFGNAQISTAQNKFGGSSAVFDGSGDYLTVDNPIFLFPPGQDVTMELWFRIETTLSGEFNGLISLGTSRGASSNEWTMFIMQNSATGFNRRLQMGHNFSILVGSTTNLNIDQWYHAAATRSGTTFTLWLDGVSQGTTTSTLTLGQGTGGKIGSHNDGTLVHRGWIDEVRISNTARYTTAFTPSTVAFQRDDNTLLLLHADGTNGSTRFVDDGQNPTVLDNAVIHASATSTASTITIPAAAAIDDFAVLFDFSTTTTNTIPSGWTSINGVTTTGIRTNISYKKLVSGDPGSSITGMAGTTRKILLIVKGNSAISSVTVSTPGSQATTATPTNQTISSTGQVTPTIFFAVYAATGAITTRGWTGGTPVEYSSFSTSGIYVKALTYGKNTTPASATISMSDGGTNTLQSFSLKLN